MNVVLDDLANLNILIYFDDICMASQNINSYFDKLNIVCQRLRYHNLRLKNSKCHFLKQSMNLLGFHISGGQVRSAEKNVEVVKNFKHPISRKQVRSFWGTLNYYRQCIPNLGPLLSQISLHEISLCEFHSFGSISFHFDT